MINNNQTELKYQISHLLNVLNERLIWFEKRQLETKRSLKTFNRVQIVPDSFKIYIIIEADLNYYITEAGIISLKLLQDLISTKSIPTNEIEEILVDNFMYSLSKISKININEMDKQNQQLLFKAAFSVDENTQRNNLKKFLIKYGEEILNAVFKEISIFDDIYLEKIKKNLKNYLEIDSV